MTPAPPPPLVTLDRGEVAELARVLGVLADFLTSSAVARSSLARFTFGGLTNPYFWTEELTDYLRQTATDLHQATHPRTDTTR